MSEDNSAGRRRDTLGGLPVLVCDDPLKGVPGIDGCVMVCHVPDDADRRIIADTLLEAGFYEAAARMYPTRARAAYGLSSAADAAMKKGDPATYNRIIGFLNGEFMRSRRR